MLAILGASGRLGGATLSALLSQSLLPASSIVAITSSQPGSATWTKLAALDPALTVRHGSFDAPDTLAAALAGCDQLFLVSTPRIEMDYNDAPPGAGREAHHYVALDAARQAGVKHVYYSSLAFAFDPASRAPKHTSKAGVMRAHLRTEARLRDLAAADPDGMQFTVLREGLYTESWPLYLGWYIYGHEQAAKDAPPSQDADREKIVLPNDGAVSWTAIADLGLANALVLTAPSADWAGRTVYLSGPPALAKSLTDVAALVAPGRELDFVGRPAFERHCVEARRMDPAAVAWWVGAYDALVDGECLIDDDPTLTQLLASVGRKPVPPEETIRDMVKSGAA